MGPRINNSEFAAGPARILSVGSLEREGSRLPIKHEEIRAPYPDMSDQVNHRPLAGLGIHLAVMEQARPDATCKPADMGCLMNQNVAFLFGVPAMDAVAPSTMM